MTNDLKLEESISQGILSLTFYRDGEIVSEFEGREANIIKEYLTTRPTPTVSLEELASLLNPDPNGGYLAIHKENAKAILTHLQQQGVQFNVKD